MENASKAILIAGAVLIVLVLIALAVGLVGIGEDHLNNIGEGTIDNVKKTNQLNKFMKYEGDVTGAQVKQCISAVLAYNSNLGVEDEDLAISVSAPSADLLGTIQIIDRTKYNDDGGKLDWYFTTYLPTLFKNTSILEGTIMYNPDTNRTTIERISFRLKTL